MGKGFERRVGGGGVMSGYGELRAPEAECPESASWIKRVASARFKARVDDVARRMVVKKSSFMELSLLVGMQP
jgi:hypothetical protein